MAELKALKKSGLKSKRSGCAVDVADQFRSERLKNVHSSERADWSGSRNENDSLPQPEHNGVVREPGVVINVPWFLADELVLQIKPERSVSCSGPNFVNLKASSKVYSCREQGLGCAGSAVLRCTCHSP